MRARRHGRGVAAAGLVGALLLTVAHLPLPALAQSEDAAAVRSDGGGPPERIGWDRLVLRGRETVLEGRILGETPAGFRFRMKGASSEVLVPRDEVERVERAPTPREAYLRRRATIPAADPAAHRALARQCAVWGLEREAEAEWRAVLALDPADREAHEQLVALLERRCASLEGEERAACEEGLLAACEAAQQAAVTSTAVVLAHSRLLRRIGAPALALERLASLPLPEASTASAAIRLERARLALELGALERAEQDLAPLLEGELDLELSGRALRTLGLVRLVQGRDEQAREAFAAAAARRPDDLWATLYEARAALYAGATEQAVRLAAALPPGQDEEYAASRAIVRALGAALAGADGRDELAAPAPEDLAAGGLEALRAARTGLARLWCAAMAGAAFDPVSASAELERLSAAVPELAGLAHVVHAQIELAGGRHEAAREALEAAARAGFDFAPLASALLRLELRLGNMAAALRYARYVAGLRAEDPLALLEAGRALVAIAQERDAAGEGQRAAALRAEARALFERAAARAPDRQEIALALAWLDDLEGAYDRARARLEPLANAGSAYAREALARIDRARARRVARDDFARPDSDTVRGRWIEDEAYGVQARIEGGRLVFAGRQQHAAGGRTRVLREVGPNALAEFRARLEPAAGLAFRCGIEVQLPGGEAVSLARESDGRLTVSWRERGGKAAGEPREIGRWPETGGAHTLAIVCDVGAKDREIIFALDGRELARERKDAFARPREARCAIWVEADLGAQVRLEVDEAAIFIVREQPR